MKPSLAGAPGFVVTSCLLLVLGAPRDLAAQDSFYYDGAKKVPLAEESSWTGYELAAGSDPAKVEAEVRKSGRGQLKRAATYDPKRRLLAVPAGNAKAPKGALRKVRLFKNGSADPIIETRELVVRFKAGVTREQAGKVLTPLRGTILNSIGDYAPNAYLVEVPAEVSSIATANRLQLMPEVQYAQPDLIWPKVSRFVPNDPIYPQQWHLNNSGGSGGITGADIKAERAWEITRGDPNVVIAILDDGVATGHEDFASGKFTGGWDFVSNDNDPRPAIPTDSHGTACAGLAAASGNNATGVSGVAPDCRLMPVRMLGSNSTPTMEAAAIAHAKNNGAWVISNSWGPADGTGASDPCPQIVNDAINDAADNGRGGKGCVILWAAGNGNESSDLDGYASHPKVIGVAATLRNDTRSPYSDFGNGVDICAPGGSAAGDMVTIDRMGSAGYSNNSNYTTGFNGTSAATPVAAGVAALILSAEPNLTRLQVTQRLIDSSDFIDTANVTYDANGHHNWYGYGRVNAFAAVAAGDDTAPAITVQIPSDGQIATTEPTASGTTTDTGFGNYLVHWWVFNVTTGKWWNPKFSNWQNDPGDGDTVSPSGNNWSIPLPALGEGSFQLHVKAEDRAGNPSPFIIRNYQVDNNSPTLAITAPAAGNQPASPPAASGTAADGGSGVKEIRVALRSVTTDRWWNWSGPSSWTGPAFAWENHVTLASGTTAWSKDLPVLPEGSYELFIQALDNNDAPSAWTPRSFTIDGADPVVTFTGLVSQQQIVDFSTVTGTVSEPATVTVKLTEYNVSGTNRYWNGSSWTTHETDPGVWRPAVVSGNTWQPQNSLPGRANTRQGHYILEAKAVDVANKQDLESLVLIRTATDTSIPNLAIASPTSGAVLTDPVLPALNGTVSDPESGIAGVSLYVMRSTGSGFTYWTGSGWSLTPTELPAQSNGSTWSAPMASGPGAWSMPSHSQLVNGAWQVQVSARNGEQPAGTRGVSVSFTVDYHPVYELTLGSYSDEDPNNNNSLWNNPGNWSPYGVPGSNDIALIQTHSVTSSSSLTLYGIKMLSGSLGFSAGPGVNGTLTTTGKSEWAAGTFHGWWMQNGTLTLSGTVTRQLSALSQLRNSGTVTWTGGITRGFDTATVTNLPGGVWILAASGDAFDNHYPNNQFINQGILRQSFGADVVFNDWNYTLGGQIQRQGGALLLEAAVTVPGGAQFTHAGSLRMMSGSLTTGGTISNADGLFEIAGGHMIAASPVTLGGSYRWSGGSWSGNFTVPAGSTLSITGDCRLNTSAVLNNAGTVHWNSPSPLNGFDTVTVNNLASGVWRLEANGNAFSNHYQNNVFNNLGLLEKVAAGETGLREWSYVLPGHTRVSAGTLRIEATAACPAGALLSGPGTLDIGAGSFSLGGEITSTVANLRFSGGTMTCAASAKIQGDWSWIGGYVTGSLEVPVSRKLTLNGSFQLNTSSTLVNKGHVLWQGPNPLIGYDSVTVTNMPGATWELAAPGSAFANHFPNNHFHNRGLLTRTAPTGDVILSSWTYHQSGVINATAASTQFHSTLNLLAGGSFTGAGAFSFHYNTVLKGPTAFTASAEAAGGGFIGEATGLVNGTLRWTGGVFSGTTRVAPGAFLRLAGTASKVLSTGADLDVAGELIWEQGDLTGYESSRFYIRSGAFLRVQGSGSIVNHYAGNRMVIEDGGTFVKTNSGDNVVNWAFDNGGTAAVNAGKLILNGGGRSDGAFSANNGGVLSFASGTQTLETGATLSGGIECNGGTLLAEGHAGGRIDVKGGSVGSTGPAVFNFSGACTWTGGVLSGALRIPAGASLAVSGPDTKLLWAWGTLVDEGLIEWSGGSSIQGRENSTIDVRSGAIFRLSGDGDIFANHYSGNRLLLSGILEKTAGTVSTLIDDWLVEGNGTFRPMTARIDLNTNVNLLPGARFEGAGRTRFASSTTAIQGISTILPGSTVELAGTTVSGHGDGTAAFTGGAIDWSTGWIAGIVQFGSATTVSGSGQKFIGTNSEIRNSGTMTLAGTGQFTGYNNSTFRNLAGGTLTCNGSAHLGNIYGGNRLVNEGTLAIGGPLGRQTIDWAFQQATTGILAIDVTGENAAIPEFDILHATGGIQLAGKLQATKGSGYVPAEDTTFAFITGSTISGTFTTVQATGFSVEYAPGSATLRAGDSGTGFEEWTVLYELAGASALSGADPDHDGVENFLEYAFNTDPNLHTAAPVTSSLVTVAGQKWITLHYRSWQDRIDAGLGYYPEGSANFVGWNPGGVVDEEDPDAIAIAGSDARRCRILLGTGKGFLRMKVE